MKTYAERDGDDFILNGSKVFITGGINADMVIVCALTDKNAKKATAKFSRPGYKAGANSDMKGIVIYEYCITASDKNGESPKSEITNTDPRNW